LVLVQVQPDGGYGGWLQGAGVTSSAREALVGRNREVRKVKIVGG